MNIVTQIDGGQGGSMSRSRPTGTASLFIPAGSFLLLLFYCSVEGLGGGSRKRDATARSDGAAFQRLARLRDKKGFSPWRRVRFFPVAFESRCPVCAACAANNVSRFFGKCLSRVFPSERVGCQPPDRVRVVPTVQSNSKQTSLTGQDHDKSWNRIG